MAIPFEPLVAQDLNRGYGDVDVTMPAGGTMQGQKVGIHTFLQRHVNIQDFGAADDLNVDSTAAIQAALNALPLTGGVLHVPPGNYRITKSLVVGAQQLVRICGGGGTASIFYWYGGANTAVIQVNSTLALNTQDLEISHLNLINGSGAAGVAAIQINSLTGESNRNAINIHYVVTQGFDAGVLGYGGIEGIVIKGLDVSGGVDGIRIVPTDVATQGLAVRDSSFQGLTGKALDIRQVSELIIENNTIQTTTVSGDGIYVDVATSVVIRANQVALVNNAAGIAIYLGVSAIGSSGLSGMIVEANNLFAFAGLKIDYASGVAVQANVFFNCNNGIVLNTHAVNVFIGPQQFIGGSNNFTDNGANGVFVFDKIIGAYVRAKDAVAKFLVEAFDASGAGWQAYVRLRSKQSGNVQTEWDIGTNLTASPGNGILEFYDAVGGSTVFFIETKAAAQPGVGIPSGAKQVLGLSGTTTSAKNLRGSATFVGAATVVVAFPLTNEPDASYYLSIAGNVNETFWVTGKGVSGFTLHSSNAASTATVDWVLIR